MTKKEKNELIQFEKSKISKFDDHYLERDPEDPNSREIFRPWKLTIIRSGKSGFSLTHSSMGDLMFKNPLKFILLFSPNRYQCFCTPKGSSKTICKSFDRVLSTLGEPCTECKYKDENFKAKDGFNITTKLDYYILVYKEDTDEFLFTRFNSSYKNIDILRKIVEKIRNTMKPYGIKSVSRVVVSMSAKETTDNNNVVYRFDPNSLNIEGILSDSLFEEVKILLNKLIEYDKNFELSYKKYTAEKHSLLKNVEESSHKGEEENVERNEDEVPF